MKNEDAIKWLIKPTVTSTEVSPTKAKELEAYNMAIEALSAKNSNAKTQNSNQEIQKSNGDSIYRADAIEAVVCHIWHMPNDAYRQFNCENIVREVVEDAINRLPSAEAIHGKWISCSERLPERNGVYLAWMQWPFDEEPTVSIINYDADCEMFGEWHEYYHPITLGYLDSDFDEIKGVIAWMPMPEPYREDGEA